MCGRQVTAPFLLRCQFPIQYRARYHYGCLSFVGIAFSLGIPRRWTSVWLIFRWWAYQEHILSPWTVDFHASELIWN